VTVCPGKGVRSHTTKAQPSILPDPHAVSETFAERTYTNHKETQYDEPPTS